VIERDGIGSQASGYSAGGLNPLEGAHIPGPLGPLAMESFNLHLGLWDSLREDTDLDFQSRIVALTKVACSESEEPALQESLDTFNGAKDNGFSGKWLDRQQLLELEPRLSSSVLSGVYLHGNAALDSHLFTRALAAAAENRGASIRSALARGVRLESGRVQSVILEDGEIPCGQLILAAGPWSREAEPWLDISLAVDPLKGEILRLQPDGPPLTSDFNGAGASLYPKPDGLVWCGTTEEWEGFNREPTEAAKLLSGKRRQG
jgi:glycine/D-amino acid oxidase-like deaminating enzyme